jgi:hypothetical protein
MVLQKQKELTQVMQMYARVSNRLTSARIRVRSVREGLQVITVAPLPSA